jgi:ethanolamine utilization protein EutA
VRTIRGFEETVLSVGIDIGTTTTQLVISSLTIVNIAPGACVPRMEITEKKILYKSQIYFTPLKEHNLIDPVTLLKIVEKEYQNAGVKSEEIGTGAVIITGEAAKKENARSITEALAGFAGDFVVATAGPNLESVLAGKGSGSAAFSKAKHMVIVNIDVGGGTSNFGIFKEGNCIDTACLNIGGHLVELEKNGDRITYLAEPARLVLRELGLTLNPGDRVDLSSLTAITDLMAGSLLELLGVKSFSKLSQELLMTPRLRLDYPVENVVFSGGVADFIYSDYVPVSVAEVSRYGDVGPLLGYSLRQNFLKHALKLHPPAETIRATVIGAGAHSVSLSGSTISIAESALPLRNIPVVSPFPVGIPLEVKEAAELVQAAIERLTSDGSTEQLALAILEVKTDSFQAINELAEAIARGARGYLLKEKPLVIVCKKDCAKVLGQCLHTKVPQKAQIVCIDQVEVTEGDFLDIGKPLFAGTIVPVVVKTLVFSGLA